MPPDPARAAVRPERIEIRPLHTQRELQDCVALQRATWGADFDETVPPSILKVAQRIGGIAAGAFSPSGELLGFVFGMSGVEAGRPIHWSDMLAVRADARGLGLGRRLKQYQRDHLRALGVETIYWSYDPLVARNARLNLVSLGAEIVEYVPDMYGESNSVLHAGLGTDRCVVAWRIGERAGQAAMAASHASGLHAYAPIVNPAPDERPEPFPDAPEVRIQVPVDIHTELARDPAAAAAWRASTRAAFVRYLAAGYRVTGFSLEPGAERGHYRLAREAAREEER